MHKKTIMNRTRRARRTRRKKRKRKRKTKTKKRKTQVYKDLGEQYFSLMPNQNKRRKATKESAADRIRKVSVLSLRREFLFSRGLYPHMPLRGLNMNSATVRLGWMGRGLGAFSSCSNAMRCVENL